METRKILVMVLAVVVCVSTNASGLRYWKSEYYRGKTIPLETETVDAPDRDNFARGENTMCPFTVISDNCVISVSSHHWRFNVPINIFLGNDDEHADYKIVEEMPKEGHGFGHASVFKVERISDSQSVPFSKWIELYDKYDEAGKETLLSSYGPIRILDDETDEESVISGAGAHHWGKNVIEIDGYGNLITIFDRVGDPDYIEYEACVRSRDSGTAQLIKDNNQWKLAGIASSSWGRMGDEVDLIYDYIEEAAEIQNLNKKYYYDTIQEAIDDASTGDVIELPQRTYTENIDFLGKAITLQSRDPYNPEVAAATIIEGTGTGNTVKFSAESGAGATMLGITITCSDASGIYCSSAGPTISNCIIRDCSNAGVFCFGASPVIRNCIINGCDNGIRSQRGSSPMISNCKIYDNFNRGVWCIRSATTIKNNWIYSNASGIKLEVEDASEIENNTIVHNTDYGIEKGVINPSPTITNCILWGNGDDLSIDFSASYCWFTSDGDPLFFDVDGEDNIGGNDDDDYHLTSDSRCINEGDPCYAPDPCETDIDGDGRVLGGRVDMGADEAVRVHNITKDKWYWYINEAIDDATGSDELVAIEGEYEENVDFDGKSITVRSTAPDDPCVVAETIIDASGSGCPVRFDSGEGSKARLKGFTITGGGTYGVYCKNSRPHIQQCAITDNDSHGIYLCQDGYKYCAPAIKRNKIYDNGGKGIYGYGYAPRRLMPSIKNNWIYENDSCGIYICKGTAKVYNNTIVGNTIGIRHSSSGSTTVKNSIVWYNGNDLYGCSATYSCIQDIDSGPGNIVGDPNNPLFVDRNGPDDILGTGDDDYRISSGSPCIEAANGYFDPSIDIFGQARVDDPNKPNTGIGDPNYVDMGAHEFQPE